MNAETGIESDSQKRQRGRIPQSAWPLILQRHRAGKTLSALAREFDCTPSAISYVVRKAEASGMEPAEAEPGSEVAESRANAPIVATPEQPTPEQQAAAEQAAALSALPATAAAPPPALAMTPARIPAPIPEGLQAADVVASPAQPARASSTLSLSKRTGGPATNKPRDAFPRESHASALSQPPAPPVAAAASTVAPAVTSTEPESVKAKPAESGTRPSQPPPVDTTEARLRETARACLVAYRGWRQTPGETSIQSLSDAVHDLRKVLSRIEIDMSSCRREDHALRPIPVPLHRAVHRR